MDSVLRNRHISDAEDKGSQVQYVFISKSKPQKMWEVFKNIKVFFENFLKLSYVDDKLLS